VIKGLKNTLAMLDSLLTTTWLTDGSKASAVAAGIFVTINRIGAFLDREADDVWKKSAQNYLQSGKFFLQLQQLTRLRARPERS
jgi:hypothetical protein